MRRILNRLIRKERGQALVIVLILMLLGGLIIAPLLSHVATALKAGRVHEQLMQRNYSADAGVWDALWKIMNDTELPENLGENRIYNIEDVNDKDIEVVIVLEEDVEGFLDDLLNEKYSGVHSFWTVVTENVTAGTYNISVSYNGLAANKFMDGMGAWLQGTYTGGNATGITVDYPNYNFTIDPNYKGGTAFVWKWKGANRPEFGSKTGVYTRTLTFQFTQAEIPPLHFSWAVLDSANVGVVTGGQTFGIWKVTSTATDNASGKQTQVVSYVARQGAVPPLPVKILTWETSQQ